MTFIDLWRGLNEDVGKRFPANGPFNTTFKEVRAISVIDNFHDEVKNTTLDWFPSDTKENFEEHKKTRLDDLKKGGWINDDGSTVEIKYHINQYGFRYDGDNNKIEPGGILYIGDSNVFGIGNHFHNNYTFKAHNKSQFKDRPYYNWGVGGRGIETHYRLLKLYIEEYKPYGIFLDYPWVVSRCDQLRHYNSKDEFFGLLLPWLYKKVDEGEMTEERVLYETNQLFSLPVVLIRWHKNVDAIKYLCYKHNVKCWIYNDPEIWKKMDPNPDSGVDYNIMKNLVNCAYQKDYRFGRDLLHADEKWHTIRANAFVEVLNEL